MFNICAGRRDLPGLKNDLGPLLTFNFLESQQVERRCPSLLSIPVILSRALVHSAVSDVEKHFRTAEIFTDRHVADRNRPPFSTQDHQSTPGAKNNARISLPLLGSKQVATERHWLPSHRRHPRTLLQCRPKLAPGPSLDSPVHECPLQDIQLTPPGGSRAGSLVPRATVRP